MISGRDIEELRAMMPELLRERLGITDVRRSFRCPSPSHEDSDPSAHYYEDGHTVHCFGCGKTWDAFALIGELDDIASFPEQVRALALALGYVLDGEARVERPRPHPQPRPPYDAPRPAGAQDVYDACGRSFGDLYAAGNEVGRRYLRYRGLDDVDAARWGLGFAGSPKAVMPQFSVYEPEALGFIVIPFFNADFSSANYCMQRALAERCGVSRSVRSIESRASRIHVSLRVLSVCPECGVTGLRLNRQSGMCQRCTELMHLNEEIAFNEILEAEREAASDDGEIAGIKRERDKMRQRNSRLCRKYGLKGRRNRGSCV